MKSIRVITQDFQLLTEIDQYQSALITRSWNGVGEMELHINRHIKDAHLLQKGVLLMLGGDVHKVYIIKHREIDLDQNGKESEIWKIKAPALKSVLGQRLTLPPAGKAYDEIKSDAETVMKHYVQQNVITPADMDRAINNVVLVANQNRGGQLSWNSRYENLTEELTEQSLITGLGWNLKLDLQGLSWGFDVKEGRDLTVHQSVNPPVIFSPAFDSLKTLNYSESELDYKNVAIVAGPNEGADRIVKEIGDSAGLDRHEVFIDARDIQDETEDGQAVPVSEVEAELTDRGEKKLTELQQEQYLEGQILTNSPFVYEKDYDLGDRVTIQNKEWGITMDARITKVKEIYEKGGFQIEATFGNDRPTFLDKIKQQFEQISSEVRR